MNLKHFKFIKLNDQKIPIHKFSDPFTFDQIANEENVGVLIEEPWIVIDVDDERESKLMLDYILQNNIKCNVMNTTRGKHFWFKSVNKLKNLIGVQNALSIKCDTRSFGNKGFVMIKKNGKWREWIVNYEDNEVDEIPKELIPINDKLLNSAPRLSKIEKEGEGRRNALFDRIIPLAKNGFSEEELKILFNKMNLLFFTDPLSKSEIDNLFTKKEIFNKSDNYFSNKGVFLHYKFAQSLHKQFNGLFVNGSYYFYDSNNEIYIREKRILNQKMNEIIGTLKQQQRNEVINYLETLPNNNYNEDKFVVNLKNGIYNFRTNKFQKHSMRYFTTNKINIIYDPEAKNKDVDDFLCEITCNDYQLRDLIEEMLGYCFIKNTSFQKAFVLKGYGSNGKSTLLDVFRSLFGDENLSAVGIEELHERFKRVALVDKLVNISSEMPETNLKNMQVFKKLVTGDIIDAEYKGKDSFTFSNTAKFIFSANELPKMNDTTEGFTRRLIVIPFNRYFSEDERDPEIIEKLITEEAKSYWLNLAIKGYKRLLEKNKFTIPKSSQKELDEWMNSSNSVRRWLTTIKPEKFENKLLETMYLEYQGYCLKYNNNKYMSIWKLKEEFLKMNKEWTINDGKIERNNI